MADIKHGIAGGLAGIAVDIVFYPLDTIKTRIMASNKSQNFTKIALSKFKGFSAQMIVSFPYAFTFFYVYQSIRYYGNNAPLINAIASVSAEVFGNLVRNPFQVIKQQMMIGRSNQILNSVKQIKFHRGVKGFYTGYQPTLARDIVFSAFQLPLFQIFRKIIQDKYNCSSLTAASIGGSIAACISGFISCPLDVIKTRMMTQDMKKSQKNVIKQIYSQFGINGFFRGAVFRCSILAFGGIVYFGALQKARLLLKIN